MDTDCCVAATTRCFSSLTRSRVSTSVWFWSCRALIVASSWFCTQGNDSTHSKDQDAEKWEGTWCNKPSLLATHRDHNRRARHVHVRHLCPACRRPGWTSAVVCRPRTWASLPRPRHRHSATIGKTHGDQANRATALLVHRRNEKDENSTSRYSIRSISCAARTLPARREHEINNANNSHGRRTIDGCNVVYGIYSIPRAGSVIGRVTVPSCLKFRTQ